MLNRATVVDNVSHLNRAQFSREAFIARLVSADSMPR